jgi:hypothetical protein
MNRVNIKQFRLINSSPVRAIIVMHDYDGCVWCVNMCMNK